MQRSGGRAITAVHACPRLAVSLATIAVALAGCADPGQAANPTLVPGYSTPAPQPTSSPTLLPADALLATPAPVAEAVGMAPSPAMLYERGAEIWSLDGQGADPHLLARSKGDGALDSDSPWALAPNGRLLAMATNPVGQPSQLSLLPLPAGRPVEPGRYPGRIDALRWSHDSSRLAFLVDRRHEQTGELLEQSLYLYDTVSGSHSLLYQHRFRSEEASRRALWLEDWVPGDQAVYVTFALEQSGDPGLLYALDARGGEPRPVAGGYLLKGGQAVCPLTSEVLLRQRSDGVDMQRACSPIYVARAQLEGALAAIRVLSPADWFVGAVAWSPDGQQVVVERLEAQAHGTFAVHLWLLALDGSAPRQLTSDPAYREERPVWTPDGADILFERWRAAQPAPAGLWSVRPGSEAHLLDAAGGRVQCAGGRGVLQP